jgi:hypothetical protein
MGVAEVAGTEGVGRGVMSLLWLWKGVEKSKTGARRGANSERIAPALRQREPAFYLLMDG